MNDVSVRGSYVYTHAMILGGDLAGRRVPNVPRHRTTVQTVIPVGEHVTLGADGTYVGTRLFESDYQNTFGAQNAHVIVNLKVQYKRGQFKTFLDVRICWIRSTRSTGCSEDSPWSGRSFPHPE